MPSLHEVSPGERSHEIVGKLADGRQVLLTTRFGPVEREGGERAQLTLLVFDADGTLVSSEWRVLEDAAERAEGAEGAIDDAMKAMLTPLGPLMASTIEIQPVPLAQVGEPRAPSILTSEDNPELSVTLSNDEAYFIPGWPFGGND